MELAVAAAAHFFFVDPGIVLEWPHEKLVRLGKSIMPALSGAPQKTSQEEMEESDLQMLGLTPSGV